jgi:four helix bundle protein
MEHGKSQQRATVVDSFDKFDAWQAARELTKRVYLVTKNFPKDEQFGLTNQTRRAASSVAANIAEGFSRQTVPDKLHFYVMAQGSLTELQSFLIIAADVAYLSEDQKAVLYNQSIKAHKLLTGLIKSTKRRA